MKRLFLLLCVMTAMSAMASTPLVNHVQLDKIDRSLERKEFTKAYNLDVPKFKKLNNSQLPFQEFMENNNLSLEDNLLMSKKDKLSLSPDEINGNKIAFFRCYNFTFDDDNIVNVEPFADFYVGGWDVLMTPGDDNTVVADCLYYTFPQTMYMDYDAGTVTIPGGDLVNYYENSKTTSMYRYDTTQYVYIVPETWLSQDGDIEDIVGQVYSDGSMYFEQGFLYYYVIYTTKTNTRTQRAESDTTAGLSPILRDTYLLTPNAEHSYTMAYDNEFPEYSDIEMRNNVYMFQYNESTVVAWNMFGLGMPGNILYIYADGTMEYPFQQIYDYGLYWYGDEEYDLAFGNVTVEWDAENDIAIWDNAYAGCVGTVTPTEINWGPTVLYDANNGFMLYTYYLNNKLAFTDGEEFVLPTVNTVVEFVIDGVRYWTDDHETAKVIGYEGHGGAVVIPETVTYEDMTCTVTGIESDAFSGLTDITYLSIPVTAANTYNQYAYWGIHTIEITGEGEWVHSLPGDVKTLYIGSGVTSVEDLKVNPETIYCFATTPPVCNDQSFKGFDGELHVPTSALMTYFTAEYWGEFTNLHGDAVDLIALTLDKDSAHLIAGETLKLNAMLTPLNASAPDFESMTTNPDVAIVREDRVTAIGGGECDIVFTCRSKRVVCHLTVEDILPTELTLSQNQAKIETGTQLALTATVGPDEATIKTVEWSSSDQTVAAVNEEGVITAMGYGECDIIARCHDLEEVCHVIVVDHIITITLDVHEVTIRPNHMIELKPTCSPVSTTLAATSSDPDVALVRTRGNRIQIASWPGEGTATIYVNSADGYAEPDSCVVTVMAAPGDINMDGVLDIQDVDVMIDYMLRGNPTAQLNRIADYNQDGNASIDDVTALIDFLIEQANHSNYVIVINGESYSVNTVDMNDFMSDM